MAVPRARPHLLRPHKKLRCGKFELSLERPLVMGVVNVTPDSFSDGGRFFKAKLAIAHARKLAREGADIIDIGGESTRPGAAPVSEQDELARVLPVLQELGDLCVSVDTRRPAVMRAVLEAGASMINDVDALGAPGALEAVAKTSCAVCLMHKKGDPATMQQDPHYDDVVSDVRRFLAERIFACEMSGIDKKRIVVDPGFGFGKTLEHNLALLRALDQFAALGVPLLAGLSRKGMIGTLTGRESHADRAAGSAAAALLAVQKGAAIVRVHDVAATRDALAVWQGVAGGIMPAKKAQKPFGSQRFEDD